MVLSDKKLIRKINCGNRDAFRELYLRYSDLLFGFIVRQLDQDQETAADIWQETWSIAVERMIDFHFRSSVFTWLCSIAKNKISDYYRQQEKHQKFRNAVMKNIDLENDEIDWVDEVVRENVLSVLGDLNEEYRFLLMARYSENKSVGEISQAIGKSYKATESLLSRSREAFRIKFKQFNI